MAPTLQFSLGFVDLTLVSAMSAFGSTAGVDAAVRRAGDRERAGERGGVRLRRRAADERRLDLPSRPTAGERFSAPGFAGLRFAYGDYGPANSMYALALRRHMHLFGTNHDQLGTIAVGQREWALMNPRAQMRKPMTIDDYHASRWVVEPLHLFDCCLVSNGGVAVIVTSARAGARPAPAAGVPARLRPVRAGRHRRGPSASRRSTPAPPRSGEAGAAPGGHRARRRRRPRALRLLHLHRPRHPRGLRVLREGRGRRLRRRRQARPRRRRCRATPAAASSPRTTCGASRRCRRASSRRAARAASARSREHDHVLVSGNGGALNFHSTTILSTARGRGAPMTTTAAPAKPVPGPRRGERRRSSTARCGGELMLLRCRALRDVHVADRVSRRPRPAALRAPASPATSNGRPRAAGRRSTASRSCTSSTTRRSPPTIPYNIAVVETEEGVRLTARSSTARTSALEIGMALDVTFERMSDEVAVPKFRPRS